MRSDIALNIRSWISKAHDNLDLNADVDRVMLSRMSNYVERARLCLSKNPYIILTTDNEMRALDELPTPSMVLPAKKLSPIPNASDNVFRAEDIPGDQLAPMPAENFDSPLVGAIGGVDAVPRDDKKRKRARRRKSTHLDALRRERSASAPLPASNFLAMRHNASSEENQRQQQQPQQQDRLNPDVIDIPRPPAFGTVISDDVVSALSEEAALQLRMMALSQVKEMRPSTKFSSGSPMDFRNKIIRFDAAVNIPGMTDSLKLLELKAHFGGLAETIIDAHIACPDAGDEYRRARSEIAFLFGGSSNSILPALKEIIDGPQVMESDAEAHLQFYAELVKVESLAAVTSQQQQLNHSDNLAEIVENRLAYSAKDWWLKDLRRQEEEGLRNSFFHLKKLMQDAIHILRSRQNFAPQTIDLTSAA